MASAPKPAERQPEPVACGCIPSGYGLQSSRQKRQREARSLLDQALQMQEQLPLIVEPTARQLFMWQAAPGLVHTVQHLGNKYKLKALSSQPRLFHIPNFLTPAECDHIISIAENRMSPAKIMLVDPEAQVSTNFHQATRNNRFTWVPQTADAVVNAIALRVAALMQLPENAVLNSEAVQVLQYTAGQHYYLHTDSSMHHPRFATFLFYLNTVEKGGSTVFPLAQTESKHPGVSMRPRKGSALLFYNYNADGQLDTKALHSAMDVQRGVKWAANQWISLAAATRPSETSMGPRSPMPTGLACTSPIRVTQPGSSNPSSSAPGLQNPASAPRSEIGNSSSFSLPAPPPTPALDQPSSRSP
eukprot:TRINITY_DN3828_c0_g2_i1.p1 TRINITY_DN3828_c0_g2~~TRINITY_DN3828_c0_g2_i1.p1  ORF type:complete len:359 (+),score=47.09 TRINITY_DN3828_c0_g2_i1:107-1183(+)